MKKDNFRFLFCLFITSLLFLLANCQANEEKEKETDTFSFTYYNTSAPSSTTKLMFIHHSCGSNWLDDGLLSNLNGNNYYVTESDYGWMAGGNDIGNRTDTPNWQDWFVDGIMSFVYDNNQNFDGRTNSIVDPGTQNEIIMFKSCYPLSEVGVSIDDEKAIYNSLLNYFSHHTDKLFVLITPPGETNVSSYILTRELCNWLTNKENGWLKDYNQNNVAVFDFYCTLSETNSHHRIINGNLEYIYASDYDSTSPYHNGDDHPNEIGNQKAYEEFIPLLNYFYHRWKGN